MTDWRTDAIEAGARAILGTDKSCERRGVECITHSTDYLTAHFSNQSEKECDRIHQARRHAAAVVDAVAPIVRAEAIAEVREKVRADERERVLAEANATVARLGEQAVMDLTALTRERDAARAEVAALLHIRGVIEAEVESKDRIIAQAYADRDAAIADAAKWEIEVAALERWKAEATTVIEAWERVHRRLGSPGFIGESKAAVTYDEVDDLLREAGR